MTKLQKKLKKRKKIEKKLKILFWKGRVLKVPNPKPHKGVNWY